MSRFFEKSEHIQDITEDDLDKFLRKHKLSGKIDPKRVEDFYNALSTLKESKKIVHSKDIDYSYFNCKTKEDERKIDQVKDMEEKFIESINPELFKDKVLEAASILAFRFEKGMYGGISDQDEQNNNEYLKNILHYCEEEEDTEPCSYGEVVDMNIYFMKYIALLSSKKAFLKTKKKIEFEPNGNIVRHKPMETMSELMSTDLIQFAMPDFNKKLVTNELYVKKRFVSVDKAQNLIILVDNSGSMSSLKKKGMLQAALTLKIKDHNDASNIYIGTFIKEPFGFYKIEKSTKFSDLSFITLSGGVTDVNGAIMKTLSYIKDRKLPSFPAYNIPPYNLTEDHFEILVINDGEDHVNKKFHPSIAIHAVCLLRNNTDLKNICHRSGGTYNYLK